MLTTGKRNLYVTLFMLLCMAVLVVGLLIQLAFAGR